MTFGDAHERRTERKHIAAGYTARRTIGTAGRETTDGTRGVETGERGIAEKL